MAVVYVVTKGSYSDYRIVAVFSEEKRIVAQKLADSICGEVKEYGLDLEIPFPDLQRWIVTMTVDGVDSICRIYDEDYDDTVNLEDLCTLLPTKWRIYTFGKNNIEVICWAKDKTHAVKITNEYRARLIAYGLVDIAKNSNTGKNFIEECDVAESVRAMLSSVPSILA